MVELLAINQNFSLKSPIRIPFLGFPMEKRKKVEADDGEIQLPEAIIQHIQSFLSGKQAAQTSTLSKSWYSAWSTRPKIDFDERDFQNLGNGDPKSQITDEFWDFAMKTMRRYEELNLKIDSFRLWMKNAYKRHTLAHELIVKAMKMGATDVKFELQPKSMSFTLPGEVLESKNLIGLSVSGCTISRWVDGKVCCSRLKFLSLYKVYRGGHIIRDIISSCPLIEKLVLSECFWWAKYSTISDAIRLPLNPFVKCGKQNVGSVVDGPIKVYEFHKLKCLLLEKLSVDISFFRDFSSRFPCLKDLTLHHCVGCHDIRLSSRSLEYISFAEERALRIQFDVPSLRKFTFSGSGLPVLSFGTASGEWESDISITCNCRPSTSWFLKLKEFLTDLSPSKISLSLNNVSEKSCGYEGDFRQGLPTPVVENLTIVVPSSDCSAFLDGLFRSCRLRFITQYWLPNSSIGGKTNNDFLEILCKKLMQKVSQNCLIPNQSLFGECYLQEVNVELFAESVAEWQHLSRETLLDASTSPGNKRKIRFQLRWGLEPIITLMPFADLFFFISVL